MAKQKQEWAAQLAEQQQLVQQWQDECWKMTLSLEQKEEELDKARKHEQDLQSSLGSLQLYVNRHEHLITVPTSPLVSRSFLATFLHSQRIVVAAE